MRHQTKSTRRPSVAVIEYAITCAPICLMINLTIADADQVIADLIDITAEIVLDQDFGKVGLALIHVVVRTGNNSSQALNLISLLQ